MAFSLRELEVYMVRSMVWRSLGVFMATVVWFAGGAAISGAAHAKSSDAATANVAEKTSDAEILAATTRQFFGALEGFTPGDLLVASQVEDLQAYLRRTFGPCRLTSPRVVRSAVPDRAPLSRLFHGPNGKSVLREASRQLAGYAQIDALCRSLGGRGIIVRAIAEGDPNAIVQGANRLADAAEAKRGGRSPDTVEPVARPRRIVYTVDEMLHTYLDLDDKNTGSTEQAGLPQSTPAAATLVKRHENSVQSATQEGQRLTEIPDEPGVVAE